MIDQLLSLSVTDMAALAVALRSGRIDPPYTPIGLQRLLTAGIATNLAPSLTFLNESGFAPEQIATTLEMLIRDRSARQHLEDDIQLVTTGPDVAGDTNRDTGVVVREMFANAKASVLIAGYAVYQGHAVFQALADRMKEHPEINARLFLDIQRGPGDTSAANELVRRFAERFRTQQWPQNRPLPAVFCDPRSLDIGGAKRACLHAKCVVVDREAVLISSANFTEAAQQRNIEVGLLIRNPTLAERIILFFDSLLEQNMLIPVF
jgi:phosphatidylserine/phosphatidylglycerophosphate/cardiolipin synthase-like enzyme